MAERRGLTAVLLAVVIAVPLAALAIQALADSWRAHALLPQRWGLRGLREAFGGMALDALGNSLVVAAVVCVLAVALAWPAARALAGVRRRGLVLVVLALPLLVPSYATGTGLTEWFLRLGLVDTTGGLVLAHLVLALPYAVVILAGAFGAPVVALEEMARAQGLGPVQRWRWVTLPAVAPALAAAALLAFLASWSEYGSSLAVGGGRPLLPIVLLPFVGADPQVAAALSLLFLAPAVAALVLAARAARSPL